MGQHVAIVGAGIAGLSCATQLRAGGFEVSVFDKSKGVGGRMSHRYFENWEADHGAQYFTARDARFQAQVDDWLDARVVQPWSGKFVTLNGAKLEPLAADEVRYVGAPAMTSPAKWLAKDLAVYTQHTVSELSRNPHGWELSTREHGRLNQRFDVLILAIPSVQAQHLIGKTSALLEDVCREVVMLPCWTLLAYFDAPLDLPFDGAMVEGSLISWLARDSAKPNRPATESWVAQAGNAWSAEHVDLPRAEVEPRLLRAFKDLTGAKPTLTQTHLWRYARLAAPNDRAFGFDPAIQAGVCGDWLKKSTIESAWLSGYRLAHHLMQAR